MKTKRTPFRSPLMWKAGVASVDQAMLSALSFVVSIILIQSVPKSEFGYYSIALAISLFLSSVQNAIVNAPLAVLLVKKKDTDRGRYAASLCYGQFLAILPAVCLAFVAIKILKFWGSDITRLSIAAALSSAVAGLLFREFLRSYLYAEEAPGEVLKLDILYVTVFMGLLALTHLFWNISAASVFVQMGVSAMLVSLFFSRNRGWEFRREEIRKSYRENWKFGKWALLGVCVTHAQNYSYLYLLGAISGSMAVADVSAARLLLMPLMLVRMSWGQIAIPHGSNLREEGQIYRFFKEQIVSSVVFLLAVAVYVVLILAFSGVLQNYLLSEKYANSFQYVVIWGAIVVAGFIAMNASYGLQVLMGFSTITKISFFVMIVTVGSAYFLIRGFGIAGGLTALLLGQIVLAVCLWIPFGKIVFSIRKRQDDARLEEDGNMKLSEYPP